MLRKIVYYWVPLFLWCFIIFYISSIPYLKTDLGFWDLVLRKIAHIVEYGILFLLSYRVVANSFPIKKQRNIYIGAIVFSIFYAFSDEFHQAFVPGRVPSLYDVFIDTIGIFSAFVIYKYYKNKKVLQQSYSAQVLKNEN